MIGLLDGLFSSSAVTSATGSITTEGKVSEADVNTDGREPSTAFVSLLYQMFATQPVDHAVQPELVQEQLAGGKGEQTLSSIVPFQPEASISSGSLDHLIAKMTPVEMGETIPAQVIEKPAGEVVANQASKTSAANQIETGVKPAPIQSSPSNLSVKSEVVSQAQGKLITGFPLAWEKAQGLMEDGTASALQNTETTRALAAIVQRFTVALSPRGQNLELATVPEHVDSSFDGELILNEGDKKAVGDNKLSRAIVPEKKNADQIHSKPESVRIDELLLNEGDDKAVRDHKLNKAILVEKTNPDQIYSKPDSVLYSKTKVMEGIARNQSSSPSPLVDNSMNGADNVLSGRNVDNLKSTDHAERLKVSRPEQSTIGGGIRPSSQFIDKALRREPVDQPLATELTHAVHSETSEGHSKSRMGTLASDKLDANGVIEHWKPVVEDKSSNQQKMAVRAETEETIPVTEDSSQAEQGKGDENQKPRLAQSQPIQHHEKLEFSTRLEGDKVVSPAPMPKNFARDFVAKISDELKAHIEGRSSEVRVIMKPESMGQLSLRVVMEEGKLVARMDVSQPAVRLALEAQLPLLREALTSQGIDVQRFEIASGDTTQFEQSKEGNSHQQRQRSHSQNEVEVSEEEMAFKSLGYNTVEYII